MASTEDGNDAPVEKKKFTLEDSSVNADIKKTSTLTDAQRARAERNRQKACALREARLVQRPK